MGSGYDSIRPAWLWAPLAASLLVAWRLRRIHWLLAVCVFYSCWSTLFTASVWGPYTHLEAGIRAIFDQAAFGSLLSGLLLLLGVLSIPRFSPFQIYRGIAGVSMVLTFVQYAFSLPVEGFVHNGSMNGCLIAVLIPFIPLLTWPLAAFSILACQASIPCMTAGIVIAVFLWQKGGPWKRLRWWEVLPLSVGLAFVGLEMVPDPTSFGLRNKIWKHILDMWTWDLTRGEGWTSFLFGVGQGMTRPLLPAIQVQVGKYDRIGWFIWGHSDPLQLAWEQGLVGLALWSALAGVCLWRARRRPEILAASTGWLFVSLVNYPAHVSIFLFIAITLGLSALRSKQT